MSSIPAQTKGLPPPGPPYPFWLGGVAATCAVCFTHPLDAVKNRLQTQTGVRQSMGAVLVTTARQEGLRGIYQGLSASVLRQLTYSLARFAAYDDLKNRLAKRSPDGHISNTSLALSAMAAGVIGGVAGNPADIMLVRMTSDLNKPPEKRYNYPDAVRGAVRMAQDEGVTSLFRGLAPNLVRAVLMNATQLATYDMFKSSLLGTGYFHEGTVLHFSASFMAGTVATTVCSPADVIKATLMNAPNAATGLASLKDHLKTDGAKFLFRGYVPSWIRLTPNTILIWMFFEQFKIAVDWSRAKRIQAAVKNTVEQTTVA